MSCSPRHVSSSHCLASRDFQIGRATKWLQLGPLRSSSGRRRNLRARSMYPSTIDDSGTPSSTEGCRLWPPADLGRRVPCNSFPGQAVDRTQIQLPEKPRRSFRVGGHVGSFGRPYFETCSILTTTAAYVDLHQDFPVKTDVLRPCAAVPPSESRFWERSCSWDRNG